MEIVRFLFSNILFLFFIYFNASYDEYRIQNGKPIYHNKEALLRSAFCVFLSVYIENFAKNISILIYYFYFLSLFWLLFDYLLYHMRNLPWDYISPDNTNKSSKIDMFFKRNFRKEQVPIVILYCKIKLFIMLLITVIFICN